MRKVRVRVRVRVSVRVSVRVNFRGTVRVRDRIGFTSLMPAASTPMRLA